MSLVDAGWELSVLVVVAAVAEEIGLLFEGVAAALFLLLTWEALLTVDRAETRELQQRMWSL